MKEFRVCFILLILIFIFSFSMDSIIGGQIEDCLQKIKDFDLDEGSYLYSENVSFVEKTAKEWEEKQKFLLVFEQNKELEVIDTVFCEVVSSLESGSFSHYLESVEELKDHLHRMGNSHKVLFREIF